MADNIVLGRGRVFFDRFATGTETATGERYLGATPSFGLQVETQELEHYSSEEGLRVKDLSVTSQIDLTGTVVTENIDLDNIALFFLGAKSTVSVGAQTGATDTFTSVLQGTYLQLGKSAGNPAGLRQVSSVVVTGSGGTPTYVEDTDYTVDLALGRVYIVPGGGITGGTDILVTYNVAAHDLDRVVSGTTPVFGAMRFLAYNGVGNDTDYFLPKVAIRPNGEYNLKGDDWQQFGFNIEVLKLGTQEQIYADGRPYNIV